MAEDASIPSHRDRGHRYDADASPFRRRATEPLVRRAIPVTADLSTYRAETLRRDAIAGVTVAALAIPAGIAFASVAGLPPVAGLYALLLPTVAYAFTGSSKRLMVGPEGTTATMTGAAIAPLAATDPARAAGAAASLALLVGLVYLVARVVRLGWLADYFSRPVLVGYIHGVLVVLMIGQLGKLTGVSIAASDPIPELVEFVKELGDISLTTFAVGATVIACLFALRWRAPKAPAALIVVVASIVVSYAADLSAHGVATIGNIPSGLPSFEWPGIRLDELGHLALPALGIFAVSFADAILTARSWAGRHLEHVSANQELYALGVMSIASGVTQGFPVSSSGSRTAVADGMGVRTQAAAIFSAITVAVVLLFVTAPIAYLPSAVLGGVIVYAGFTLIDRSAWRDLARHSRREVAIAAMTTIGVLTVGILRALVIAVALSILDAITRSARPHDAVLGYVPRLGRWADVEVHRNARVEPGVVVYRLDDRLFFANASYVAGRVREAIAGAPTATRWLVFDAESLTAIDSTGLEVLERLIRELGAQDVGFAIARARTHILRQLAADGFTERIGGDHIYATVRAAVAGCTV